MSRHRHIFWKGLFSLLLALIWVAASTLPAFADVAPPPQTQSSGIIPDGEQTQVRMMYENVFMDIALDGTAKVDANFVMRNLGDKEEVMDVYFPLYIPEASIYFTGFPDKQYSCQRYLNGTPIKDLAVWVWDQPVPVRTDFVVEPGLGTVATPSPANPAKFPCWGVFAVRFPPGLDVPIEVKYTSPDNKPEYGYVLTTGAGWNGTIGQADITFRLPYDAILGQNLDDCTPKCTTKGRDIQWQFMDFEPTKNIQVTIVWTGVWWRILTETNTLKLDPNDGAAWKRLALAYDASAVTYRYWWSNKWDPWPLYNDTWRNQKALKTLQKAIALNAGDLSLQDAFATRICYNIKYPKDATYRSDWEECLQQIQKTIALAPTSYSLRYDFVGLVCLQASTNSYADKQSSDPDTAAAWVECSRQIKQLLDLDPKNWKAKLEDVYTIMPAPLWPEDLIKVEGDQPLYLLLPPITTPIPTRTATIAPNKRQTEVRMMYENVFMNIDLDGTAKVDANFVMRNLSDKEEKMDIYFPLFNSGAYYEDSSSCEQPYIGRNDWITDLAAWAWDKPLAVRTDSVVVKNYNRSERDPRETVTVPCWGVFSVVFPPGLDVPIEVKYTNPSYWYILETGAGWKGTIGKADITFRLPYDAVLFQNLDECTPRCTINGRDIQWQFVDFEPKGNLGITIVKPDVWWRILTEVNYLKLNPKDKLALKRLAIAYKDSVLRVDASKGYQTNLANQWRYQVSVETFRKAISLNEGDFDLHYQFANLVCINARWPKWFDYPGYPAVPSDMTPEEQARAQIADWTECAQQLKQSLDIDPKNKNALDFVRFLAELEGGYSYIRMNGDRPDLIILTPTPTFAPTTPATITPTSTPTIPSTLTPSPSILPSQTPSLTATLPANAPTPIPPVPETEAGSVWAWILIPLAAILALVVLRRRNQ